MKKASVGTRTNHRHVIKAVDTCANYPIARPLPEEVRARRDDWFHHFKWWRRVYFSVGTIGAAVSAIAAAAASSMAAPYLAAASGICFAILGFTHPERSYLQYVRAWRILDGACKRYEYEHTFAMRSLLNAIEKGERSISEFEYTPEAGEKTVQISVQRPAQDRNRTSETVVPVALPADR